MTFDQKVRDVMRLMKAARSWSALISTILSEGYAEDHAEAEELIQEAEFRQARMCP